MNEFQMLIEKSEEYLQAAKLLLDNAYYDSAVSRNYYAMFYATQAILETKEISVKTHTGLIGKFSELFIKTGVFDKQYSQYLAEAFESRSVGDYDIFTHISKEYAEELYEKGLMYVATMKSYLIENQFIN
jgi:uncharacterized protein (UPF0332 family)